MNKLIENKKLLAGAVEDILVNATRQTDLVESAIARFGKTRAAQQPAAFADWLIFDYDDARKYSDDITSDLLIAVQQAALGFYQLSDLKTHYDLKNIITSRQYAVAKDVVDGKLNSEQLLFGRVIRWRGEDFLGTDYDLIPAGLTQKIVSFVGQAYSRVKQNYYTIDEFISHNPQILHTAKRVAHQVQQSTTEQYVCYELISRIVDRDKFRQFLASDALHQTEDSDIYSWLQGARIISEVVVSGARVVFECNSLQDLEWVADTIDEADYGVHKIDTKLTNIDDIIDSDEATL